MQQRKLAHLWQSLLVLLGATLLPMATSATVIFQNSNDGGGTDNVAFNPCNSLSSYSNSNIVTAGMTVSGCLNTSHTTFVEFTGIETLKVNGGQARIEADVGTFDYLLINMEDPALGFTKIVFNVDAAANGGGNFRITANVFGSGSSNADFVLTGGGQNYFTVVSNGGDVIQSLSFTGLVDAVEFNDTAQVRVALAVAPSTTGNACPAGWTGTYPDCVQPSQTSGVPEPGTLALLGLGLAGLAASRRRRH